MPGSSPDTVDTSTEVDTVIDTAVSPPADTTEAPKTEGVTAPDSPPATAGTMLDAVNAALKPKDESPSSKEPGPADAADPDAPPAESAAEDELSAEELKALSWKTQQRFKKLTSIVKQKDAELGTYKQKAEDYDKIVGSINNAGLDNREVDELIEVGAMLKRDPHAALAKMLPIVQALQNVVGEVLSPELQEQVRLGYLTEAHAKELQRTKATATLATRRADEVSAQTQAEKQAAERNRTVKASVDAVERWESQQSAKDPDWQQKRNLVAEQVELAIDREARKRGAAFFPTAAESVTLATEALKTVNTRLKQFSPKTTEIRSTTPGSTSTRSKAVPKSTLEAINNALG